MGTLNTCLYTVHLIIYTLWFDQSSVQTKGSKSMNNHLRATLPKILIFNFHPEIDFAHNSSINFPWQVGNFFKIF